MPLQKKSKSKATVLRNNMHSKMVYVIEDLHAALHTFNEQCGQAFTSVFILDGSWEAQVAITTTEQGGTIKTKTIGSFTRVVPISTTVSIDLTNLIWDDPRQHWIVFQTQSVKQ